MRFSDTEPYHQFLYVIAGDGSTRVVRRELDINRTVLGRECDTQVDPTAVLDLVCHPAAFPGENPPDRRPFARGPGIRPPGGALITDWTFQKTRQASEFLDDPSSATAPFDRAGVTGIGTTTAGRLVFVTFDQFNPDGSLSRVSPTIDRLGLLDATIQPHMLWPDVDPRSPEVPFDALPRMVDAEPSRGSLGRTEGANALKVLAPTLRRVDLAYSGQGIACSYEEDDNPDGDADDIACQEATGDANATCGRDNLCRGSANPALLSPRVDRAQGDGLASPTAGEVGGTGMYTKEVVRAVVRDYQSWLNGNWRLEWEGSIPGTRQGTGQLVCEKPGWEGGTCISTEPGDTRIVDTAARFCDAGVLGGDKLQILGCLNDDGCGAGQFCLIDPRAPTDGSGICVSQTAFANRDYLLQVCEDLLYDPCGSPVREFLVTRAFQNELWLQAMDRPESAYLMYSDADVSDDPAPGEVAKEDLCNGTYLRSLAEDAPEPSAKRYECNERLVCAEQQPETGCTTHEDCLALVPEDAKREEIYPLCIDGLCRRVCGEREDGTQEDCVLRRLPGPTCLRELIEYNVAARHSFVLKGPGVFSFLTQKVRRSDEDECYEDPDVSNLMTSRFRVGVDEADTRNNSVWPIPSCPPGNGRPDASTPNPCFIDTPRPESLQENDPNGVFHHFRYGYNEIGDPGTVPALRLSNPMLSLVLDLTSLKGLTSPVPGTDDTWEPEFREFQRSRLPRTYNETFDTRQGYNPLNLVVVTQDILLVGPTRIISAPEAGTVFVVDSSGDGGSARVRGQVLRVSVVGGVSSPDPNFRVH